MTHFTSFINDGIASKQSTFLSAMISFQLSASYLLARSDGIAVGLSVTSKLIVALVLILSLAFTAWLLTWRAKPKQDDDRGKANGVQ